MNTNILTKCIDALKQEKPDLSYVRGMLETLVEMQPVETTRVIPTKDILIPDAISPTVNDEAAILDAKARASLTTIKAIAEASKQE